MAIASTKQMKISSSVEAVALFAEVRECLTSGSKSLHARIDFMEGQIFSKLGVKEFLDRPNYLSLQINQSQHIMLEPEWLQYINHSCNPNIFFDTARKEAIVLKPIEVGEEITFFYPSTEWSMNRAFDCFCNSEHCLGKIQGSKFLSPNILADYKLSNHIRRSISSHLV